MVSRPCGPERRQQGTAQEHAGIQVLRLRLDLSGWHKREAPDESLGLSPHNAPGMRGNPNRPIVTQQGIVLQDAAAIRAKIIKNIPLNTAASSRDTRRVAGR